MLKDDAGLESSKMGGPSPASVRDALAVLCFRKLTSAAAVQVPAGDVAGTVVCEGLHLSQRVLG